jgi:hypothetical protein
MPDSQLATNNTHLPDHTALPGVGSARREELVFHTDTANRTSNFGGTRGKYAWINLLSESESSEFPLQLLPPNLTALDLGHSTGGGTSPALPQLLSSSVGLTLRCLPSLTDLSLGEVLFPGSSLQHHLQLPPSLFRFLLLTATPQSRCRSGVRCCVPDR